MNGKCRDITVAPDSTIGWLRRHLMLASGCMNTVRILVDTTMIEGDDRVIFQALKNHDVLTVVVLERADHATTSVIDDIDIKCAIGTFDDAPAHMSLFGCSKVLRCVGAVKPACCEVSRDSASPQPSMRTLRL